MKNPTEMSVEELRKERQALNERQKLLDQVAKEKGLDSAKARADEFVAMVREAYEAGQEVAEAQEAVKNWAKKRQQLNKQLSDFRREIGLADAYKSGYAGSFGTDGRLVYRTRDGPAAAGLDAAQALLAKSDLADAIREADESEDA